VAGNPVQPKVAAALQAGAGPDSLQMQWTWAHLYADKLLDVSDIAEPAGSAGGGWYDAAKQNNFVQGRWRAVPFGLVGNAIAYCESYLKEGAGVDKFPATWEEYTTVGRAVKEKKNSFVGQALGHSFGDPPTFILPFLWSHGGAETDETGKRVTINSPETQQALVAFKAWFEAASDPECLSWDDSSNNRAFLAEQVWATLNGASIYVAALKDRPELAQDIQHALLPRGPKGHFILAYPIAFAIPSYVKDPTPAKELLSYLLNPKVYGEFMKQGKGYTQAPYKKGEDELWPSTDPKFDPYKQIGNLSRWYGYPAPPSPQAAESGSKYIVVDMFAKVAQGESPQSAMQWAEAELKKIFGA
jgi:multiple sugar transport system substrate-binding protein